MVRKKRAIIITHGADDGVPPTGVIHFIFTTGATVIVDWLEVDRISA